MPALGKKDGHRGGVGRNTVLLLDAHLVFVSCSELEWCDGGVPVARERLNCTCIDHDGHNGVGVGHAVRSRGLDMQN